jgi:6-pyruvoyltetrahydropterin/6-carboxytetrahydropterin synthase
MEGEPDATTMILIDYNAIKQIICKYDHQIILNSTDPMVKCIKKYQHAITTPGDPTSELLAQLIRDDLHDYCCAQKIPAKVTRIRVWESPNCFAEIVNESQ